MLLAVALASTLALSALSGHTWYSIALTMLFGLSLAAWALTHRTERGLRGSETSAAVVVALLAICAFAMIYATYADHSNANVRGFLRAMLYALLGPALTTVMAAAFAVLFVVMALETGLGAYWSRQT